MQVVFFSRKPSNDGYSIEELFETIRENLPPDVESKMLYLPYASTGVWNRLLNLLFAYRNRGEINHVTGDVHYLTIALPGSQTVLTVHDCGELEKQRGMKRFLLWLFWFYIPVKRAKYITTVSATTKRDLSKYVNRAAFKTQVVHNCLIGSYRRKTVFNWACPRILQVGVTINKNIDRILPALHSVKCKLVILGKPSASHIELLDSSSVDYELNYHLSRKQVADLYHSCELLLYPSTIEGFGLPIIEAQSTGIPVITSGLSSMPEIAGKGALFVDPYDVSSIRSAVLKILNEEVARSKLIYEGFENVKRFAPANVAQQYYQLYKNVLDGRFQE